MPSESLRQWNEVRIHALDEIEGAHESVGGAERGRRFATQQINCGGNRMESAMSKQTIQVGQLVTFKYGTRNVQGLVKEDRGPIGMKGRVLYLVEFRPETQSGYVSHFELPADRLQKVEGSVLIE